jgi:glycosyltransferase involved in cell wall biosynthesis
MTYFSCRSVDQLLKLIMQKKIACIFSFQQSSWVSCQKIVFNLHEAYQLAEHQLVNFNYNTSMGPTEASKLSEKIYAEEPDFLVVMDHKPHPLTLFQFLLPKYKGKSKPRIIFHVFGDFTLHYSNWSRLSELLIGFQVDFIVASDRQKVLIDKFLRPPHQSLVCPFPVNNSEFCYRPELRQGQRQDWGLKEHDKAFVFTGRLSRQKRIHTLLLTFAAALTQSQQSGCHLFLYGTPDSVGDPFLGNWENENEYFRKIDRIYEKLPQNIQANIHFMGSVPNRKLLSVYSGADYLLNLSVHNDEDYGMSVAESQACGLPAILTDWGGLSSFEHPELPAATCFIPVRIGERSKQFSYGRVTEELRLRMQGDVPEFDRKRLAKLSQTRFGITAASSIINKVLSSPAPVFEGFNEFFNQVTNRTRITYTPYLNQKKKINNFFREIYSAYVRNP